MKKLANKLIVLQLMLPLLLTGCSGEEIQTGVSVESAQIQEEISVDVEAPGVPISEPSNPIEVYIPQEVVEGAANLPTDAETSAAEGIQIDAQITVPVFSGNPYVEVNENTPFFSEEELLDTAFEYYAELDSLGRCGTVYANICPELMPTEERGKIGHVKPSGWQSIKYDIVDGKYLYNRCHLIGYQLSGENANEHNLITGTRYLNIEGMLPFENMVADYVAETGNHVLYRVTPIFTGSNLLADGVLMEGYSVEDDGAGICFCIFAYNTQPGIEINYADGTSKLIGAEEPVVEEPQYTANEEGIVYILNTSSKKYHLDSCQYAQKISEENRETFNGTTNWLTDNGYEACGVCNP